MKKKMFRKCTLFGDRKKLRQGLDKNIASSETATKCIPIFKEAIKKWLITCKTYEQSAIIK